MHSNSHPGQDFIEDMSNGAWEKHRNSQAGQDFIEDMSVIQMEPGKCTETHNLDRIS